MEIKRYRSDFFLLGLTGILTAAGLLMVYSSSAPLAQDRYGASHYFVLKQFIWALAGGAALLTFWKLDYNKIQIFALPLWMLTVILLLLVLWIGPDIGGARRWLRLGPLSFQPSELAKLACVLSVASYADKHRSRMGSFQKGFLQPILLAGILCGLIVIEPDLGTPILLGVATLAILAAAGARFHHILLLLIPAMLAGYALIRQAPYRWRRLLVFLDPWADPQGAGYQVVQSLLAIGSGGIFGRGLGTSRIKLLYLPEPHTDFIFPILAEELGFLGSAFIVILFTLLLWRGVRIALRAPNLFGSLMAWGLIFILGFQALINMSVALSLVPTKGMPLPFLSFGGSSLLFTLTAIGILLSISSQIPKRR